MDANEKAKLEQALGELRAQLKATKAPRTAAPYCHLMEVFVAAVGDRETIRGITTIEPFVGALTESMKPVWKAAYRAFLKTPTGMTLGLPPLPVVPPGRRPSPASPAPVAPASTAAAAPAAPSTRQLPQYDPRIDQLPKKQQRWARTDPLSVRATSAALPEILMARQALEEIAPTLPVLPSEHPVVKDLLGRDVPLGAFVAILLEWIGADRLSEVTGLDIGYPEHRGLPHHSYLTLAAAMCVAEWGFPGRSGRYSPDDFVVPRAPNALYPMPKRDLLRLAGEAGFTPMHLGAKYMTRRAGLMHGAPRTRYELDLDRWPGKIYDATNAYRLVMSAPQRRAVKEYDLEIPVTISQEVFDSWFDANGEMYPEARTRCLEITSALRARRKQQRPARTPEEIAMAGTFSETKLVFAAGDELARLGKDFSQWFEKQPYKEWWFARLHEIVAPPNEERAAREKGQRPEPLYLRPTLGQHVTRRHRMPSPIALKWQWEVLEYEWGHKVTVTESSAEAFDAARATLRQQLARDGRLPPAALSIPQRSPTNEELLAELLVVVPSDPPADWVPPGTPTSPLAPIDAATTAEVAEKLRALTARTPPPSRDPPGVGDTR